MNLFKTPVHYLHISKTGGTSIIHHLTELNQNNNNPYEFCFYNHQVLLRHLPKDQQYFFSVRDPISRFVSGFYSTKNQNKGIPWTSDEKIAFDFFSDANDLAENLFVTSAVGSRAHDAMLAIKHVAGFQCSWLDPQRQLETHPPVHVLFQETLESDFNALLSKLALDPISLTVKNNAVDQSNLSLSQTAIDKLKIWYQRDFAVINRLRTLSC